MLNNNKNYTELKNSGKFNTLVKEIEFVKKYMNRAFRFKIESNHYFIKIANYKINDNHDHKSMKMNGYLSVLVCKVCNFTNSTSISYISVMEIYNQLMSKKYDLELSCNEFDNIYLSMGDVRLNSNKDLDKLVENYLTLFKCGVYGE